MSKQLILAIDFDGTIAYQTKDLVPKMFLPLAKETINWLYDHHCKIIIWTCRCGESLKQAKDFLDFNQVKYHKINENIDNLGFETSNKIFASIYIDDRSFSLNSNWLEGNKIDWMKIKEELKKQLTSKLADEILESKDE